MAEMAKSRFFFLSSPKEVFGFAAFAIIKDEKKGCHDENFHRQFMEIPEFVRNDTISEHSFTPCPHFFSQLLTFFMSDYLDSEVRLQELKDAVKQFAVERDWEQFHTPKNLSMAIAAEAAELMEHFLWKEGQESLEVLDDPLKNQQIAEELADILIFSLEFANITKLDVASIIRKKMEMNALKYPVEKAKGRADKYTELE
jgi:dCTP diphosphatase